MRILVLAEGNPESVQSGSGTVHSVVTAFRAAGHTVLTGDAELYGPRWLAAASVAFSPWRRRWGAKFRTGPVPFAMRSRRAATAVPPSDRIDAVFQYGSTFTPRCDLSVPYFLYMDSCMRIAAGSKHSWAGALTASELAGVIAREQGVYERATAIFTFSDAVRDVFARQVGIPDERLVTTYAGPNLDLSRIPDRSPLPGTDAAPTILFVGREFERKGGDLVLRALERVREALPRARLLVVGTRVPGGDPPGVRSLGLLRKEDPTDWERLLHAYRSAHVFCFPTRYEPFGIVVLEAMLFGLPCVATRTGAIPEMVVDGQSGFLVSPEDVDALAAHLLTLLRDPDLAGRLGRNGQKRAEQNFTWSAVASKMLGTILANVRNGDA
jgi:glycosyltransferase involved in cell wall biosynthesis